MSYANPIGSWAVPMRIDQGVDYGGSGPLFAIDDGVITNVSGPGWPGGTYIVLKMDHPVAGAQNFYYAENIAPAVSVGQRVKAGQVIGHARGSFPFTELGFSNSDPHRDNTLANQTGQSQRGIAHGDPGTYTTGWGLAASNFIKSLGGKPGIISPGGISGSVPNIGNPGATAPQQASTTSAFSSGGLGGILSIPSDIVDFFQTADQFVKGLIWLTKPANWIRIVAFLAGVVLLMFAIRAFILVGEGRSPFETPQVMPVPV